MTTSGNRGTTARQRHWDRVFRTKAVDSVSWFRPRLQESLDWIDEAGLDPASPVIDIGAGASTLVDDLLARGFREVDLLDVSGEALQITRRRLGDPATVRFIEADVTRWRPPAERYGLWHDRAVFHFLVDSDDRRRYAEALRRGLRPGGRAILATFGLAGPERCSGLPTRRYSPETLVEELGPGLVLDRGHVVEHTTPSGTSQQFTYALMTLSPEGSAAESR